MYIYGNSAFMAELFFAKKLEKLCQTFCEATNISKDTNNNNLIIDKKNIDMGKARVVIKNGKWE